jgi:hypothetical protein
LVGREENMNIVEIEYPGTWLKMDDEDKAWEISNIINYMDSQLVDMAIAVHLFEEETRRVAKDLTLDNIKKRFEQEGIGRARIEKRYREEMGDEAFYRDYGNLIMKIDREMKREKWKSGELPESYKHRLQFIHAHSFLYALDSFGKFLDIIADEENITEKVTSIRDEFNNSIPSLRKIRNSALHIEDRSRGFGTQEQAKKKERMKLQPINNRMIKAPKGALVLSNLNGNRLGYTIDDGSFQEIEVSIKTLNIAIVALQSVINCFNWQGPQQFKPY